MQKYIVNGDEKYMWYAAYRVYIRTSVSCYAGCAHNNKKFHLENKIVK